MHSSRNGKTKITKDSRSIQIEDNTAIFVEVITQYIRFLDDLSFFLIFH